MTTKNKLFCASILAASISVPAAADTTLVYRSEDGKRALTYNITPDAIRTDFDKGDSGNIIDFTGDRMLSWMKIKFLGKQYMIQDPDSARRMAEQIRQSQQEMFRASDRINRITDMFKGALPQKALTFMKLTGLDQSTSMEEQMLTEYGTTDPIEIGKQLREEHDLDPRTTRGFIGQTDEHMGVVCDIYEFSTGSAGYMYTMRFCIAPEGALDLPPEDVDAFKEIQNFAVRQQARMAEVFGFDIPAELQVSDDPRMNGVPLWFELPFPDDPRKPVRVLLSEYGTDPVDPALMRFEPPKGYKKMAGT